MTERTHYILILLCKADSQILYLCFDYNRNDWFVDENRASAYRFRPSAERVVVRRVARSNRLILEHTKNGWTVELLEVLPQQQETGVP